MDRGRLVRLIASIGVEGARWIEENVDEQFKALQYLHGRIGDLDVFPRLVIANALVSYQLSGRGEDWWWEFARWFSKNPVKDIPIAYRKFLPRSRTNRRLVSAKIRRLERVDRFLAEMDTDYYYKDMLALRDDLARVLGSQKYAKTVVFAVKMFGYAMRIATNTFIPYPMEIPIPSDSRIRRITERLGGNDPLSFWQDVANASGVPPLHIDSIVWPLLRENARKKFLERFGKTGSDLVDIVLITPPR